VVKHFPVLVFYRFVTAVMEDGAGNGRGIHRFYDFREL
jgi:hypothetical protein